MRNHAAAIRRATLGTLVLAVLLSPLRVDACSGFLRGDADASGRIEITDPIFILGHFSSAHVLQAASRARTPKTAA